MIKSLTFNELPETYKHNLLNDKSFRNMFCRSWVAEKGSSFFSSLLSGKKTKEKIGYDFRGDKNSKVFYLANDTSGKNTLYLHMLATTKAFKLTSNKISGFIKCNPSQKAAINDIEKDFNS
jgi:hypothetical protein